MRTSRRAFLQAGAAALFLPAPRLLGSTQASDLSDAAWLASGSARSTVVEASSRRAVSSAHPDFALVAEMMDRSMVRLSGAATPEEAWRVLLAGAGRIAIKFNHVGAGVLGTNEVLARVLVDQLYRAEIQPDRVTLIEVPPDFARELECRAPAAGWGESVPLSAGDEQLAQYLFDADAIISVGVLKAHSFAGMSGCMKNLSHALLRRPARYHANGCAPAVAEVIAAAPVRKRLRLNILNALRVVADGGPDPTPSSTLVNYGGLILGADPLAVDSVGYAALASERKRLSIQGLFECKYLGAAAELGLGRWRASEIERVGIVV